MHDRDVVDPMDVHIVLMDSASAAALAQILPLLLLTLMVELRRLELHRRGKSIRLTRVLLGLFFLVFGFIECALVLSIDGALVPFQWGDLLASLAIFGLLAILFWLSLQESPSRSKRSRDDTL
ncbi:hypothetical protein ACIRCZ_09735 [Leifsonia sp. NPDC102414]|uniref:hypothetical protein n=1 Tax=unclassified Leifsonia TaxID=2663824 RepID=UPI001F488F4F|nr:hypothetical protein [Leifsonia sp. Root227]